MESGRNRKGNNINIRSVRRFIGLSHRLSLPGVLLTVCPLHISCYDVYPTLVSSVEPGISLTSMVFTEFATALKKFEKDSNNTS